MLGNELQVVQICRFCTNKVVGLWVNVYIILQLAFRRENISNNNQGDEFEQLLFIVKILHPLELLTQSFLIPS